MTTELDPSDSAAPRGEVLLAAGNGQLLSHPIEGAQIVIGRDPGCDFTIDHPSLSRRHAVLMLGDTATIRDLGSTNGTRVHEQTLRGGDAVQLGDAGFRIGPYAFVLLARHASGGRARSGSELLRVVDPTLAGSSVLVRDFATSGANVLIRGETGVGKEVLAATLHALSGRKGPFVQVNCAALSETLLESELFGHERGAFTGATAQRAGLVEAAGGGTLLLDEIGELPRTTQAKLLRVLEQREVLRLGSTQPIAVDVRFLAATNRDLADEVERGGFRADLYYRLDGVTLSIPPLRDRPGAVVPLALEFLAATRPGVRLGADVIAALTAYAWPGNVRELKAVITRAAVLAGEGEITARHLTFVARGTRQSVTPPSSADQAERDKIVSALAACAGNQSRAAKLLGISRTTLVTKIRIFKIPRPTA